MLHILGLEQDWTACSWMIGRIASNEALLLDALSQSHEVEKNHFRATHLKASLHALSRWQYFDLVPSLQRLLQ
jgi:hypothetical protein